MPISADVLSDSLDSDELHSASANQIGVLIINNRVTTALLLAAGTGSRLRPLTLDAPKCLTEVGGEPILGRLVDNLRSQGIKRLVVVTGYLDHCVREFLEENAADFQLDYVFNPVYQTTNNIYSLWLARQMIDEPFILIESDLVFEPSLLDDMMTADKIAVSNILPWMNGTVVELNSQKKVSAFRVSHSIDDARQYKTVNIYSFSMQGWNKVVVQLDKYIANELVNEYYETVFTNMVADGSLQLDAVFFDENKWYEIDTLIDLNQAELMFPRIPQPVVAGRYSGVSSRPSKNVIAVTASSKTLAIDTTTIAINGVVPEKTVCH